MTLDADTCYRAIESRDARFDGRFFVGVKTTGVYCRPVCPARTPLRRNVDFYRCATEAEAAGFRPCLRCRPETSPGTPAWLGTSATVSRALRLIAEGAMDDGSVEDLAARLGVGDRHLRRLFDEHLGASPVAVAQTRRLHFAKKLMDETAMPLTDVAYAAGFGSLRRFNSVFLAAYGASPSQIRERKLLRTNGRSTKQVAGGALELKLAYRPPFAWDALLRFFEGRVFPGVEHVEGGVYHRVARFDDVSGVISVRHAPEMRALIVTIPPELARHASNIAERVRRMFDLRADTDVIARQLSRDPLLRKLVKRTPGLRVPGCWDGYELAIRAILGQQISVAAATTISGRIVAAYGTKLELPRHPALTHAFPAAAVLAAADMTGIGVTRKRVETLRAMASAVVEGRVSFGTAASLGKAVDALDALPGIGPWTAHYIALRAMGEPDGFPTGDLGLLKAIGDGKKLPTARELDERAEGWRPWRAYACLYLWNSLGGNGG